jgi:hypothetical protein
MGDISGAIQYRMLRGQWSEGQLDFRFSFAWTPKNPREKNYAQPNPEQI